MSHPDPEPTIRRLEAGRLVLGRFVLVRRIGAGGMGEVWLARDQSLDVEVGLKLLPEHVRWSPTALATHKAEALRARALAHPHVVRVHDFAEDDTLAAIVMEHVDGRTLDAERQSRPQGILQPGEILAWLPQLASALDYLHGHARLVHGDIKPANLLLRADGTLKLADFGVARPLHGAGTGEAGGTRAYLSPQRVLGAAATPADDLYSLGVTLYELLAGRPPFRDGDLESQIALLPPPTVRTVRAEAGVAPSDTLPPGWEETIAACLAKRAEDRPPTAGALAARLAAAPRPPRRPRRRLLLATGAGALALALAWGFSFRSRPAPRPAPDRPVMEFREGFDSGLAGWRRWGDPTPRTLQAYQGRTGVFDSQGDSINSSGATSVAVISAPGGLALSAAVRLDVTNPAGCHLTAAVGLTLHPEQFMDALGSKGDGGEGLGMILDYVGDTCWGSEPAMQRHAYLEAWYTAGDGRRIAFSGTAPPPQRQVDHTLNRWVRLEAEIAADRRVRFLLDGVEVWASPEPAHSSLLAGQRVVVSGRSSGSAGKAYHDEVVVSGFAGAPLRLSASAPPLAPAAPAALPWSDTAWRQVVADGAEPVAWPENGAPLQFAAARGRLTLASRREQAALGAVEFEVQPLLNSGGDPADTLTLFAEQHIDGRTTRWAVEFRGTEIRLAESDSDGRHADLARIGTYAPGTWTTLVLSRDAEGRMELVGSRLEPQRFATPPAPDGRWIIGMTIAHSADGAAIRPPRLSLGR